MGPGIAVFVAIGSSIGFLITSSLVVAARAFTHVFVGLLGAGFIQRGLSFFKAILITAPVHGILEATIVMPFGFTWFNILVVVGVGTVIHHLVDGTIAYGMVRSLQRTKSSK